MKHEEKQTIYHLKISLNDIKPVIWRRILVKYDIMLSDLHNIIQVAFDWKNSHLHQFEFNNNFFGLPRDEEEDYIYEMHDDRGYPVWDFLEKKGDKLDYEYDLGDGWMHTITLEKIVKNEELVQNPICIDGANCAPPEDCGAISGYYQLVKSMKNPKSKEYKENVVWLGKKYDSKYFDLAKVNKGLKRLKLK